MVIGKKILWADALVLGALLWQFYFPFRLTALTVEVTATVPPTPFVIVTPTPTPFIVTTPAPTSEFGATVPTDTPSQTEVTTTRPGFFALQNSLRSLAPIINRLVELNDAAWTVPLPIPESVVRVAEAATVTTAVATTSFAFGQIILDQLLRVLQLLGLLGKRTSRGFVYDNETKKPISFALITIRSIATKAGEEVIQETVVSDERGLLKTVNLPPGSYILTAAHPDYSFPVPEQKPWYISPFDFYQGEPVELFRQHQLDVILVPMQPLKQINRGIEYWLNGLVLRSLIHRGVTALKLPLGMVSWSLAILHPTLINLTLACCYIGVGLYQAYKFLNKPHLGGAVLLSDGNPIAHANIKIMNSDSEQLVGVVLSDKIGHFNTRLKKGKYRLLISKDGYQPADAGLMSFAEIELIKDKTDLNYTFIKTPAFDLSAL